MPTYFSNATSTYPGIQMVGKVKESIMAVELLPEDIRSLNSVPVTLLVPALPTSVVAPLDCMVVGKEGSTPYSAAITLSVQYGLSPAVVVEGGPWDGSVSVVEYSPNILTANQPRDALPYIGIPFEILSDVDVTGGDAPCTIILTYKEFDLTGLL